MKKLARVGLVGTGRLAHGLATACLRAGTEIATVYGRSEIRVRTWCDALPKAHPNVRVLHALEDAPTDLDAYLLAVTDDALHEVASALPEGVLRIHFAGAGPAELPGGDVAVVWPIQSFALAREVDWDSTHTVVSSKSKQPGALAHAWATSFAASATFVSEDARMRAHAAAVFASNYSNRMFTHAQDLAEASGLPWEAFMPLVDAAYTAASTGHSDRYQTGPARRGDRSTLARHLALLSDRPALAALYTACAKDLLPPETDATTC